MRHAGRVEQVGVPVRDEARGVLGQAHLASVGSEGRHRRRIERVGRQHGRSLEEVVERAHDAGRDEAPGVPVVQQEHVGRLAAGDRRRKAGDQDLAVGDLLEPHPNVVLRGVERIDERPVRGQLLRVARHEDAHLLVLGAARRPRREHEARQGSRDELSRHRPAPSARTPRPRSSAATTNAGTRREDRRREHHRLGRQRERREAPDADRHGRPPRIGDEEQRIDDVAPRDDEHERRDGAGHRPRLRDDHPPPRRERRQADLARQVPRVRRQRAVPPREDEDGQGRAAEQRRGQEGPGARRRAGPAVDHRTADRERGPRDRERDRGQHDEEQRGPPREPGRGEPRPRRDDDRHRNDDRRDPGAVPRHPSERHELRDASVARHRRIPRKLEPPRRRRSLGPQRPDRQQDQRREEHRHDRDDRDGARRAPRIDPPHRASLSTRVRSLRSDLGIGVRSAEPADGVAARGARTDVERDLRSRGGAAR